MRFTVCESTSPPIKELILDHYMPWYCDVDTSTEWYAYASGLGSFILPLIAVIDPAAPNTYLSRSTGIQSPADFYARLWVPLPGDIDHSGAITLVDAIFTLQIITGSTPSMPVFADGDINNDQRLGLAEAMYILNHLAQ
jgi:hypothetical protein